MTVLTKGKALYPFWGERLNLITGLDPLGLQGNLSYMVHPAN